MFLNYITARLQEMLKPNAGLKITIMQPRCRLKKKDNCP